MAARTIGSMAVGEKGNLYPSGVLTTVPILLRRCWLDPVALVYDAPGLGTQIERTNEGFVVQFRRGKGSPTIVTDLEELELEECGFMPAEDWHYVDYFS